MKIKEAELCVERSGTGGELKGRQSKGGHSRSESVSRRYKF